MGADMTETTPFARPATEVVEAMMLTDDPEPAGGAEIELILSASMATILDPADRG